KILGQHAEIVVTQPDQAWTGWATQLEAVRRVPGVRAATPYLESEVMVQSPTNNAGIEFRGIDSQTVGGVTDLAKDMQVGTLDGLDHPDTIKTALPSLLELGDDGDDDEKPGDRHKSKLKAVAPPPAPAPPV